MFLLGWPLVFWAGGFFWPGSLATGASLSSSPSLWFLLYTPCVLLGAFVFFYLILHLFIKKKKNFAYPKEEIKPGNSLNPIHKW